MATSLQGGTEERKKNGGSEGEFLSPVLSYISRIPGGFGLEYIYLLYLILNSDIFMTCVSKKERTLEL